MRGHSHVIVGGVAYLAVLAHPLPAPPPVGPLAAPLLGASGASLAPIPGAGGLADPSGLALAPGDLLRVAVSLAVVLGAALAPDLDSAGSTAARSLGLASRSVAWTVQHVLHHRGPLHSALAVLVSGVLF